MRGVARSASSWRTAGERSDARVRVGAFVRGAGVQCVGSGEFVASMRSCLPGFGENAFAMRWRVEVDSPDELGASAISGMSKRTRWDWPCTVCGMRDNQTDIDVDR